MKKTRNLSFFEIVKKLFEPRKHIGGLFEQVIIGGALKGVFIVSVAELIRRIVDAIQSDQYEYIYMYIGGFVVLFFLHIINDYIIKQYTLRSIYTKTLAYIQKTYIGRFFDLSNNYSEKIGTGRFIHIIDSGSTSQTNIITDTARQISSMMSRIICSMIYIFYLNLVYGFIAVGVVGILFILGIKMQHIGNIYRRKRKKILVESSRTMVRQLSSKMEIIQSNHIDNEIELYDVYEEKINGYNKKIMRYSYISNTTSKFCMDGLKLTAILAVSYGTYIGALSIGAFVSIMIVLGLTERAIFDISRLYIQMMKQFINVDKLRDVFDNAPYMSDFSSGSVFTHSSGDISMKNISFGYEGASLFSRFSLSISGGSKIALVGPSGSGKSTLIKLIAGYLRPDSGSVYIDNQSLSKLSLKSYYSHIGYLTQEPSVFDGTIRENLIYAVGEDTKENVIDTAIKDASCEFIYDLPNGIDTEIGERGIRLSGGQRQRLAIAKIFLKNPKIIILDEPTSALDSESEEAVTQAMNRLFEGRTVIIIAHRLQTVKHADRIIYLEKGAIAESGTHEELLAMKGKYRKMVELQSGF